MPKTITSPESPACSLVQVARILEAAPSWMIFTHRKIDGDALGSGAALFEAGLLFGKKVSWMGPDHLPPSFLFLPNTNRYIPCQEFTFDDKDELYIFLDSANEERSVIGLETKAAGVKIVNIDHHEDNTRYGTINCVDPNSSSCAELLLHIMQAGGWEITPAIAECLYTGILTDTGGFMFSNTNSRTHRLVAELLDKGVSPDKIYSFVYQTRSFEGIRLWNLVFDKLHIWGNNAELVLSCISQDDFKKTGASASDTDGLSNQLLTIRGVDLAVLLVENEKGEVKVSFRSKAGGLRAAAVARSLGGGGHPNAAGVTLKSSLKDAIDIIKTAVDKAYDEWLAAAG